MPEPRAISFTLPCGVEPKQSFRARKDGRNYPTPKTKENARALAAFAAPHRPEAPFVGPLRLDVEFRYRWRKKVTKKQMERLYIPKDTAPDIDNLTKQLCDVLQKCGFYMNDGQVASLAARKVWCNESSVVVNLRELAP